MPTCTQAGIVTSKLTNVPAPSYSLVNTWTTHAVASATHSLVISPATIGNLLISLPFTAGTVAPVFTAPSSSGSAGWADSGQGTVPDIIPNGWCSEWFGHVTTVGSQTLTVPYTGTISNSCLTVLEFTCPGVDVGTVWSKDSSNKGTFPAASIALNYPPITPVVQSPELYVGSISDFAGFISAGSSPGVTYLGSSSDGSIDAFNPNSTIVQAPNAVGNSANTNGYCAVAMMMYATIAHAVFDNIRIFLPPITTGRMWIISQIGFEFLPANTLQTITANIVLNGRVVKPGINPNAGQFQGPPYITVRAGDTMWVDLFNVPVGASAVANFLYNEYSAYAVPHDLGGVV